MKKMILGFLLLAGCYHMKWARFVDGSEDKSKVWACTADDDPTNPKGIMCCDLATALGFESVELLPAQPDGGSPLVPEAQTPDTM